MIEIIPAVLPMDMEELARALKHFEAAGVTRAHVDICDGEFVDTKTIEGFTELATLTTTLKLDIHLMVQHPERYVDHWWQTPHADRFIFHIESTDMFAQLSEHAQSHGNTVIAGVNPDTPLEKLQALDGAYDAALFMTVHPGLQGQPFLGDVVPKIARFRHAQPDTPIWVDGGITPTTAPKCIAAGVGTLVVGSYAVGADDIAKALSNFHGL